MSTATPNGFVKDAWQTPRNARTLRAFMALQNQDIGRRIAELRKAQGSPPQTHVAAALGVGERTYQSWEQGDAKPGYRNLQALAAYFGVGEDFILTGNMAETPDPFAAPAGAQAQLDRIETDLAAARTERHDLVGQLEQRVRQLEQAIEHQNQNLARQSTILERIEEREQRIFKVLEDAEVIERAGADIDREPPDVRGPEPAEPLPQESEPDTETTGRDGRQARGRRSGRA